MPDTAPSKMSCAGVDNDMVATRAMMPGGLCLKGQASAHPSPSAGREVSPWPEQNSGHRKPMV